MHVWSKCIQVKFHDIDYKNVVNFLFEKIIHSGGGWKDKSGETQGIFFFF